MHPGFHEIHPSFNTNQEINGWNSMSHISNGFAEINMLKRLFFELYKQQVSE